MWTGGWGGVPHMAGKEGAEVMEGKEVGGRW